MHGLYSSAGAWIPVLNYFRGFQVTLVSLDYQTIITNDIIADLLLQISSDLPREFDVAIGHSFGCYFLHLLRLRANNNIYIAPPFLSSKFDFKKYLDLIESTTSHNLSDVALVVRRAIELNDGIEFNYSGYYKILLPSSDEFFSYVEGECPVRYYPGDHSDLEAAIEFAFSQDLILC